jgi:lipid-A-disaccharide synthase
VTTARPGHGDGPPLWISAGETSGDQRAAEFLTALSAEREAPAFGIAGPQLRAAGVEPVLYSEDLGVMGIAEVLQSLPRTLAALAKATEACRRRRPALAVLVDYGEFHMRLGVRLRRLGIPVFHLAPPKLWAWGAWRTRRLLASADAVGVLFPFEAAFYRDRGIRAVHVGHPIGALTHGEAAAGDTLLLLPGSRPGEWRRHLDLVVAAAAVLRARLPLHPVLGRAPGMPHTPLPEWLAVRDVRGPAGFRDGALALAASGTVNLELAALGVPQVVFYRTHPLTAAIGRRLVRLPYVNPLNINAGRDVVPELLQEAATVDALVAAAEDVWHRRQTVAAESRRVLATLDRPAGLREAAAFAWSLAA